jgi:hypothetical protein
LISPIQPFYWFILSLGFLIAGCEQTVTTSNDMATMGATVADREWQVLAHRKIFFGHQSVGYNILDGVHDLLGAESKLKPRIAQVNGGEDYTTPILGHAEIGQNTDPLSKIAAFEKYMDSGIGQLADVAMFKFCYVDVDDTTDVKAVFQSYTSSIERVRRKYPSLTIAHLTMPLVAKQEGIAFELKDLVKKILGRTVRRPVLNAKRDEFNRLLIQAYSSRDPVFDLAKIESTLDTGERFAVVSDDVKFPALLPKYTDDGGHLNASGRKIVAAQFVKFLAAIPLASAP